MIGKHMTKWIDQDFHNQMTRTRQNFYCFMKYPLLLKLTLTVFIFTIHLSIPRGSSQFDEYKNPKKLYELQNYYTIILWRYLNHLFQTKEAVHAFEIIVMQILHYQKLMITMENYVRKEPHHNVLHSLMKSIFRID
jgi:hypothetical protein